MRDFFMSVDELETLKEPQKIEVTVYMRTLPLYVRGGIGC
jgi:hypothetical protein